MSSPVSAARQMSEAGVATGVISLRALCFTSKTRAKTTATTV
ncbi:hypothetical protein [Nitratireductor mangrovi]|nr:hypothetical protein [Nitratireductor mangrovi]